MPENPRTAPLEKAVHEGMRSSLVGIGTNLVLAAFECVAGYLGHSFALVADGVESLSDVVSSTVVFFGLRFAIKPPDEEHPYGHRHKTHFLRLLLTHSVLRNGSRTDMSGSLSKSGANYSVILEQ